MELFAFGLLGAVVLWQANRLKRWLSAEGLAALCRGCCTHVERAPLWRDGGTLWRCTCCGHTVTLAPKPPDGDGSDRSRRPAS